jgi:hypothetical protein
MRKNPCRFSAPMILELYEIARALAQGCELTPEEVRSGRKHTPPESLGNPVLLAREGGDEFNVARSRSPCAAIPEKAE